MQSVFEQAVTDVDEGSVDLALERSSTIICREKVTETNSHFVEKGKLILTKEAIYEGVAGIVSDVDDHYLDVAWVLDSTLAVFDL